jgi:hypothetical protein
MTELFRASHMIRIYVAPFKYKTVSVACLHVILPCLLKELDSLLYT